MVSAEQDDSRQPRLALVVHALSGGGAERVLTNMANHWSGRGLPVTLITLTAADSDVYRTAPAVQRVGLDVMRDSRGVFTAVGNNVHRAMALRRALRAARPDFVISFTDQINVLTLLAAAGLRMRVIVCQRVDPRHHPLGRAWSTLRRLLYRRCHAAVVQTADLVPFVQSLAGRRPVYVIPNAVGPEAAASAQSAESARGDEAETPRRLVAMGRLAPQKGFDLLIDAFGQLAERHPDWTLDIFGEGPRRDELRQQIERHALSDRARLRGWTDDHLDALDGADLFVLPSRYEGFPNVLLDAMSRGVPAVSFNCPTGPAEIIRPGVDGLLAEAEDVESLAAALDQLMADKQLRRQYGRRARDVIDRFSEQRFYARWEALFQGAPPDAPTFRSAESAGPV